MTKSRPYDFDFMEDIDDLTLQLTFEHLELLIGE